MMKKFVAFVLLILTLFSAVSLAACGDGDSEFKRVKKDGVLIVGINENEPMNYYDKEDNLVGFDADLAREVCKLWGVKAEFIVIDWDSKEEELESGNIDCIWNGLTVCEERKGDMSFSEAYLTNRQCVVIKSENAKKFTTSHSLSGGTLTCESDSTGEEIILEDVSLAKAKLLSTETQKQAINNVAEGKAHAAVVDMTFAKACLSKEEYSKLTIAEGFEYESEDIAVGFRVDSDLVKEINEALDTLSENGTAAKLMEKYGLQDFAVPPKTESE